MKYIFIGIVLVAGLCLSIGYIFVNKMVPSTTTAISFPEHDEVLYLKKDNWGVSGDKQIMALSVSRWSSIDKDSESDYILEGLQQVFYKRSKDTLTVFVRSKFKLPKNFNSKIVIKQVELENPQFEDLFNKGRDSVNLF